MNAKSASMEERLSYTLSFRMTELQFKRVKNTIRNFGIQGSSSSEQLRILFRKVHWISVRHAARRRERVEEYTEEEAPEEL